VDEEAPQGAALEIKDGQVVGQSMAVPHELVVSS